MNVILESSRIDDAIDSLQDQAQFTLAEVIARLAESGTDIPPPERRTMVRMRFNGEPLLGGVAGMIQRENSARLFRGEPPIGVAQMVAIARRALPAATPGQLRAVLREFTDHLRQESTRLAKQAQSMSRLVAVNDEGGRSDG